jgi:hypothetical protein
MHMLFGLSDFFRSNVPLEVWCIFWGIVILIIVAAYAKNDKSKKNKKR